MRPGRALPHVEDRHRRRRDDARRTAESARLRDRHLLTLNPDQSQLTAEYTRQAIGFPEASRERPFFLYLAHTMPHVPVFASERFRGRSRHGLYADVVEEIDDSVEQVLAALPRLGRERDTLVLFLSDKGP